MKTLYRQLEEITDRANTLYAEAKVAKHGEDARSMSIKSDQIWAMMQAIVEHLGSRIESLEDSRNHQAQVASGRRDISIKRAHAVEFDLGGES